MDYGRNGWRCDLGYDTLEVSLYADWITELKPLEPCPKPLTNMLHIEASQYYRKDNHAAQQSMEPTPPASGKMSDDQRGGS